MEVSESQRAELEAWISRADERSGRRARIVLLGSQGLSVEEISRQVEMHPVNIYSWLRRYEKEGVKGLEDRPRPGRPRKLTPSKVREILDITKRENPFGSKRWSLRLLARRMGLTVHQVRQAWNGRNAFEDGQPKPLADK